MNVDRASTESASARREIFAAGLAGALLAALLIGVLGYGAGRLGPTSVGAFTTSYDHRVLDDPLELLLVQSDGQAFASLARDPTLARPEVFRTDGEAAYRAQRALLPYAAWALSLGRSGWVPPALALLSAAGAGLAVAGVAQLLADRRCRPMLALLVLLLPGVYSALSYCGPEPLALGLAVWGIVAWSRGRIVPALVLFALAGLCRETLLLIPAALMLSALRDRRARQFLLLAGSFVPYAAWVVFLRVRVGAWPIEANHARTSAPFVGLVQGLSNAKTEALLYALVCVAVGAIALVLARKDPLQSIVAVNLAFASVMGSGVWISWEYFGRLLLPLDALALVMIIGKVLGPTNRPSKVVEAPPSQTRRLASSPRQGLAGVVGPGLPSGGASK